MKEENGQMNKKELVIRLSDLNHQVELLRNVNKDLRERALDYQVCYFLFCFMLLCFVLFCFVLFCFVLFCFVLFCFVLFCFVLFCFVLFCFVFFLCFFCFCRCKLTNYLYKINK